MPSGIGSTLQQHAASYAADHILLRFRSNVSPATLPWRAGLTNLGGGLYELKLAAGVSVSQAVAACQNSPYVVLAQPDFQIHASVFPNDPGFNQQWDLNNTGQEGHPPGSDIHAPAAWDVTTGTGNTVVAVIDSGIDYTHPDLAASIWVNPNAGQDGFTGDIHGYDFVNNDGDPMDDNGHGTHVAGIIGAVGNNNVGVAGVAWHVQLMALKFLDSQGNGFDSDAIKAIDFAISHGATVINCSWAGPDNDPALFTAFQSARNAGIVVVTAAGNGNKNGIGQNNDVVPNYPSNYNLDNILAVAATDDMGNLAPFSNYGYRTVDLAAPGVDILSTLPGNQYGRESGTSMATPEVTGAVVLLHDLHPDWDYHQIIHRILATVDPLASLERKTVSGGQLDLAAALTLNDSSGPRITSLTTISSSLVNRVRVTFDRAVNPLTFRANDITGFVNPEGNRVGVVGVVPVLGSNNRQFDIVFARQVMPGTYHLTIGPNLSDFHGNLMNQDGDNQNGEPVEDVYTGSFTLFQPHTFSNLLRVPIPDMQTAVSTITVDQDLTVANLTVRITIAHTFDSDLFIHLISPTGTDIVLSDQRGGAGHSYYLTTFDAMAPMSIGGGRAPFTGAYQPDGLLAAFNSEDARGTWQLWVEDRAPGDSGTLLSWSLTIGTRAT